MWVTKQKSKIFSDHSLITSESINHIGELFNHLSIEKIVFEFIFTLIHVFKTTLNIIDDKCNVKHEM